MYCVRKITQDLLYVGGSDRRAPLFEGAHPIPQGISYNSYLLTDDKTALLDTADRSIAPLFAENLRHGLDGRSLDYIVVQHMEPDHSATLGMVMDMWPDAQIICSAKALQMMGQFLKRDVSSRVRTVKEGDTLQLGRHTLQFLTAPMVHWPEVMVTYDRTDKTLFSADAFGHFGAPGGSLFADEIDFERDYSDEFRRYYANIVGKYGQPVQGLLKKVYALEIDRICPLHGHLWRKNLEWPTSRYDLWSRYVPEKKGVLIAYGSIYGNTAETACAAAALLQEAGIACAVYDVSATHPSYILSEAFRYSHLLLASPTYNNGVFTGIETLLHDISAHTMQNRTVFMIQNGTWAPNSAAGMKLILEGLKGFVFAEPVLTLKSALADSQKEELLHFVEAIRTSVEETA